MKVCMLRHAHSLRDPRVRKEALALLERGHSVDIICLKTCPCVRQRRYKGLIVFELPLTHRRLGICRYVFEYGLSFFMMSVLLSYLQVFKQYHCIQVNTMPDFLVFTTIIPKLFGAKIVLDLHEPVPELWLTKYGVNNHRFLLKAQILVEQLAIRYADRCFTVTEALRQRLGERGADINKIIILPNVCDETTFYYDPDAKKFNFGDKFTLITHGLIEERYGHELVIRAVSQLRDKLPDLQLEILGDGEHRTELEKLVRQLQCEDRVRFSGFIPTVQLLQKIRGADVGVIAMQLSPYSELIDTNKMYEYMALRKPIIISRLAPVADLLDESCARFFEPGNYKDLARCIAELYHNPAMRHEIAENAYRRYQKIQWKEAKKIYLRVIHDLVGQKKAQGG